MHPTDETVSHPAARRCRNCDAQLRGDYCLRCGQRERGRDLTLWDFFGEALEDLAQVDGRVWRTVFGLLFKPGHVTADYLQGRRAFYLPPLRLYLVVSFLVFLLVALAPVDISVSTDPHTASETMEDLPAGIYVPRTDDSGEPEVLTLGEFLGEQASEEVPAWLAPWLERMANNAAQIDQDPTAFFEQLRQQLPQVMFMLLPLFALILQLAYLASPFHYLQHLIFSLHYHTTAFMYLCLMYPLRQFFPGDYGGIVLLAMFIYLPIAMTRVYGSGVIAAVVKSLAVGISYYLLALTVGTVYLLVSLALL